MGLLSNTDEEISEKAIAWDSQQHLKFDVPFEDMKPTIYLGNIIPEFRILRLTFHRKSASNCQIRQVKIASLIHFQNI